MKLNKFNLKSSVALLAASSVLLFSIKSIAAPGTLADLPLQTSSSAEANIVFLLDDSGSMTTTIPSLGISRWAALEDSMDTILNDLTGVYVGIAAFSSGKDRDGGDIFHELTLLDQTDPNNSTTISTMNTVISGLGSNLGGNSTIPAEALQDVGRYFANATSGNCGSDTAADATLTIHPDDALVADGGLKQDVSCKALLGNKTRVKNLGEATKYSCQKNFAVVMSDGQTSRDYDMRSDGGSAYAGTSTHPLWDYDQDCTAAAQTAGGYTCGTSNARDNKISGTKDYAYESDGTDYLDDVAQALYEIDLRPDYAAYKNNVTTYTVGFSADSLNPLDSDYNPLLESTALQAGGTYTFADDITSLTNAFSDITAAIVDQTSTAAAVTFNSSTLSNQSAVYQALFNTSRWGGELRSLPLNGFTGDININCTPGSNNCWLATQQMAGQSASVAGQLNGGRSIITYNPTSNSGVDFRMPTIFDGTTAATDQLAANFSQLDKSSTSDDIPLAMIKDFCAGPGSLHDCSSTDATIQSNTQAYLDALTAYFRGDRTQEGSSSTYKFRGRSSKLGDLVDSSPVFVGKPTLGWPDRGVFPQRPDPYVAANDFSYETWAAKTAVKERTQVVYVASNDGMLHGFRTEESTPGTSADAGEEVIAYIPTGILSASANEGLHYLADSTYEHKYYNDLTPTVSDAFMRYRTTGGVLATNGRADNRDWRTVLLGGLRGGGRSLYLLDVTNPANFVESKADQVVMWEFSHNDLGYTFSKPTIAMMNNGKFAAIFGNGYRSGEDGGSGDCKAKLFVVYLEGGLDGDWTDTGDYDLYDTATGSVPVSGDSSTDDNCNGLSTPAVVDLDGNGTADRIYAGDLKGNMWAFDVCDYDEAVADDCSNVSSDWGLADSDPIMTAENDAGDAQPITVKPIIARDPASNDFDDLLVVFGTGQYLAENDKTTTEVQTMYAVRDEEALSNGRGSWGLNPRDSSDKFVEQTISETTACSGTCTARTITDNSLNSNDNGWYIDLLTTGERIVVNPKIRSDIVFFNTLIPDSTTCSYGGSGWLMSVDLENGGTPPRALFDLDDSGTIGDAGDLISGAAPVGRHSDVLPAESTFLGKYQYTPGSDGKIDKEEHDLPEDHREGRMSWRELYDND